MKITLIAEDAIRLEPTTGPMTIEAESADQLYSPFHMMASGLAFCTYSILGSWASNAKLESDDIVVDVKWSFSDNPHRVRDIALRIEWPSLPAPRRAAAERVAAMCAIHATLTQSPNIVTTVEETEAVAPLESAAAAQTA